MYVPDVGETVRWDIRDRGPIFGRQCSGEVLETGLEKFGYDDVMLVDTGDDEVHVRPKDIERNQ